MISSGKIQTIGTLYLGFDPGVRYLGLAAIPVKGSPLACSLECERDKESTIWEHALVVVTRMWDVFEWAQVAQCSKVVIGIETAAFSHQGNQREWLACVRQAFVGHATLAMNMNNFAPKILAIAPNTAKLAMAGKGNAKKEAVTRIAAMRYPEVFERIPLWQANGSPTKVAETVADSLAIALGAESKMKQMEVERARVRVRDNGKTDGPSGGEGSSRGSIESDRG